MVDKQRDSRFELLRLLCMGMIVLQHFSFYGQEWRSGTLGLQMLSKNFFGPWGEIGANMFVMVTGYFYASKYISFEYSFRKAGQIWTEMFFYNLMVYIILIYAQKVSFQSNELIEKIFPFTANAYWFMTAYIMLLLLLPIFQKTINNLDLKQLKYLIR